MSSGPAPDTAQGGEGDAPGEATLLVSEFPPPPFYYTEAANLTPPEIPVEALERGTRKAAAAAARAQAETERLRLADEADKTDAILGGVPTAAEIEEDGEVVAVFGEIVEVRGLFFASSFMVILSLINPYFIYYYRFRTPFLWSHWINARIPL
jgi:hypothetical protein